MTVRRKGFREPLVRAGGGERPSDINGFLDDRIGCWVQRTRPYGTYRGRGVPGGC